MILIPEERGNRLLQYPAREFHNSIPTQSDTRLQWWSPMQLTNPGQSS